MGFGEKGTKPESPRTAGCVISSHWGLIAICLNPATQGCSGCQRLIQITVRVYQRDTEPEVRVLHKESIEQDRICSLNSSLALPVFGCLTEPEAWLSSQGTGADAESRRAQIPVPLQGPHAGPPCKAIFHEIPSQDDLQKAKRVKAGEGQTVLLANRILRVPSTQTPTPSTNPATQ